MATTEDVTVDTETDEVQIAGLAIHDEELASYLADKPAGEQTQWAERAFQVGARTLQLSESSKDIEHVKHEFDRMRDDLEDEFSEVRDELDERFGDDGDLASALDEYLGDDGELRAHLDDALGDDGEFVERLNDELGEDGERIQAALDPDRDGTPTARLESRITNAIESLRDDLAEERGRDAERQQSYKKGGDFEETVGDILGSITRQTSDTYRFTGETEGADGKVGDFVYEVGGTSKRVVVEAKTERYGFDDIQSEMEAAVENRDADYGVFVTDELANLPRTKVGWFTEFDRDFVTVALSEGDADELESAFLRFAMNWAQVRALHDTDEAGAEMDTARIRSEAEAIDEKIGRFTQVRKKCSRIEDAVDDIRDELDDIEDEVDDRLDGVKSELATAD